ncbi:hypothetical protein JVT61DRAFT_10755 [Boletus reticuloceps]|uniref:Uncharacterized protein n=1 Tax=Boletus reticuloceps TaxID=495285 RepID=A0A8I2YFQ3_9AGAM|nr:hypothetical protein JVT61DRAFT_10755 [Boletus reticuloceps]
MCPPAPTESFTGSSDLVFNYDPSPRHHLLSGSHVARIQKQCLYLTPELPRSSTPIPPFNTVTSDPRTAFDEFPLVLKISIFR